MQGQQASENLQKQLDDLKARIKNLEKENNALKALNKSSDSTVYCAIRAEVFEAFANISRLDFDFNSTADRIAVTGLFTKLIQASNPASDILGFRFTDIIFSAVEKHFMELLKDDHDKKRFSQVIGKLVNNPIVSSLASTNPVTSVVTAIISAIAGFSTSSIELEKDGGKIKDVSVAQQDAFDNRSINAFRDELQGYIDFYDAMIITSSDYMKELDNLNDKYAYLIQSVKEYKTEIYNELEVNESNMLLKLSNLLPDPELQDVDYTRLIQDERIRRGLAMAEKYPALHRAVREFKTEYNTLLFNFLSEFILILETAKNFPDKDIDKNKTENLIKDIEYFIENQKNKEKEEPGTTG
jgi:hypothetical protein